jgi:hypothetical protein
MTGAGVFKEYLLRGMIFLDFWGRSAGMWGEELVEVGLRVWDEGLEK